VAFARVAPPAVSLDRDRLDIEEQQHPLGGQVPPRGPNSGQNGSTARVVANKLARDASARQPPFFSTRRKASRLSMRTTRVCMRCSRNFVNDHRP
jgi:hypothetical protein